jgi:hypothetical protein
MHWIAVALVGHAAGASAPVLTGAKLKYEEPVRLTGTIYSAASHQLLFKFERVASRSGSALSVRRDFTYPDGTLAARERVVYEGDALRLYELEERQTGATGSARIVPAPDNPHDGRIDFEYALKPGGEPKRRTETLRENTLTAEMVGPFLASNWEALWRGEKMKCRYLVIPRVETVGFTFLKQSRSTSRGRKVLVVKMEPTSPFISALVDPLFFTIEEDPPHRVLQYSGRTTPKMRVGERWKDLDAVTVFDWSSAQ